MADNLELVIDPELESYLPGVSAICDEQLEISLVKSNGPIDPITYFLLNNEPIVADGHRRLRFCRKLNLPYTTREMKFLTKDDAKAWMDEYQGTRRNCNECQQAIISARLVKHFIAATPDRNKYGGVYKEVADKMGVSERTIYRHVQIGDAIGRLPHDIRKRIESGNLVPTAAEVFALAELPEMHQRRVLAELDCGAIKSLWDGLKGEWAPKPKIKTGSGPGPRQATSGASGSASDDIMSVEPSPEPSADDLDAFFKGAFHALGRLKDQVAQHQHAGVGVSNKILGLLNKVDQLLSEWQKDE